MARLVEVSLNTVKNPDQLFLGVPGLIRQNTITKAEIVRVNSAAVLSYGVMNISRSVPIAYHCAGLAIRSVGVSNIWDVCVETVNAVGSYKDCEGLPYISLQDKLESNKRKRKEWKRQLYYLTLCLDMV